MAMYMCQPVKSLASPKRLQQNFKEIVKWMWYKLGNRSNQASSMNNVNAINSTGNITYLWVGGLVIPEASQTQATIPLNLTTVEAVADRSSWTTRGTTAGTVTITIANLDASNPATITSGTYFEPSNRIINIIPANTNIAANSSMNFTFQVTPTAIRTYPVLVVMQTASKLEKRSTLQNEFIRSNQQSRLW